MEAPLASHLFDAMIPGFARHCLIEAVAGDGRMALRSDPVKAMSGALDQLGDEFTP